jgi:FkbM family methyltransferase
MLKSLVPLTNGFGTAFRRIFKLNTKSPQAKRVAQWVRDKGDGTLRLNYDLNENSIVFDIGGYQGEWANDIFAKYCCTIHIFEPVPDFAENIKQRFKGNPKIHVYNYGLAGEKRLETIAICEDESSTFKHGNHSVEIRLVNALEFVKNNNINTIDLMKINIEGGEYELIEHFIESEFIKEIRDIQVQFHEFVSDAGVRMKKIQEELKKTHFLTYQYEFVWENWRRKD